MRRWLRTRRRFEVFAGIFAAGVLVALAIPFARPSLAVPAGLFILAWVLGSWAVTFVVGHYLRTRYPDPAQFL